MRALNAMSRQIATHPAVNQIAVQVPDTLGQQPSATAAGSAAAPIRPASPSAEWLRDRVAAESRLINA